MKKIYNAPETILKKINLRRTLLAGSPAVTIDPNDTVDADDVEARGTAWTTPRSLWDE